MESTDPTTKTKCRRSERRKAADWLVRVLAISNLLCWGLLLYILNFAHNVRPEFNSGLVQYWDLAVNTDWDLADVRYLELMTFWCLGLTVLTLLLYRLRSRRSTDGRRLNLFFIVLASAIAIYIFSTL